MTHDPHHGVDGDTDRMPATPGDTDRFPPFPPFAGLAGFARPAGRRAGRGDIRAAILSLLSEGPGTGYALMQAIAQRSDGAWRPSSGSVYPTLQQLVDEDLITPAGNGRSTTYALTDDGHAYVADHADELDAAWRGVPRMSDADRALFRSMGRLMSAALQLRFATDPQRAAAIDALDRTRREIYRILAD